MKMTIAATRAPISGRASSRFDEAELDAVRRLGRGADGLVSVTS